MGDEDWSPDIVVAAADGSDDVEALHAFFAGIGAVDETAEAAALRDQTPPKS